MRLSGFEGRRVGIWGAGREGTAAARVLRERVPSARLVLADDGDVAAEAAALVDDVAVGAAAFDALAACDVVVRSPGVSVYLDEAVALRRRGVPFTSGTAMWFAENGGDRAIGVTGTKGKSTTSSLIAAGARAAGLDVELGGNIGRPLVSTLTEDVHPGLWVLELSSYQLADLTASPRWAVMLNLYREHLDWHRTFEAYAADKQHIWRHRDDVTLVANAADGDVMRLTAAAPHRVVFAGPDGFHVRDDAVWRDDERLLDAGETSLLGTHNLRNVAAALTVLSEAGVPPDAALPGIRGFAPLPHRLQLVGDGPVRFVNDSISTVPEAAAAALAALPSGWPLVLLVGGRERGQQYADLAAAVAADARVVGVVGLPVTGPRAVAAIRDAAGDRVATHEAGGLAEAVDVGRGWLEAEGRGALVLSPGAASCGEHRDFEERGRHFLRLVGAEAATS